MGTAYPPPECLQTILENIKQKEINYPVFDTNFTYLIYFKE